MAKKERKQNMYFKREIIIAIAVYQHNRALC